MNKTFRKLATSTITRAMEAIAQPFQIYQETGVVDLNSSDRARGYRFIVKKAQSHWEAESKNKTLKTDVQQNF